MNKEDLDKIVGQCEVGDLVEVTEKRIDQPGVRVRPYYFGCAVHTLSGVLEAVRFSVGKYKDNENTDQYFLMREGFNLRYDEIVDLKRVCPSKRKTKK